MNIKILRLISILFFSIVSSAMDRLEDLQLVDEEASIDIEEKAKTFAQELSYQTFINKFPDDRYSIAKKLAYATEVMQRSDLNIVDEKGKIKFINALLNVISKDYNLYVEDDLFALFQYVLLEDSLNHRSLKPDLDAQTREISLCCGAAGIGKDEECIVQSHRLQNGEDGCILSTTTPFAMATVLDGVGSSRGGNNQLPNMINLFLDQIKSVNDEGITLPKEIIAQAFSRAQTARNAMPTFSCAGNTTATCVSIDLRSGHCEIGCIGDSSIIVVENDRVLFHHREGEIEFNAPFSIGLDVKDIAPNDEHANYCSLSLKPGHVVVVASDGLWDNLFDSEIIHIINETKKDPEVDPSKQADTIAYRLTDAARKKMNLPKSPATLITPFGLRALKRNYDAKGLEGLQSYYKTRDNKLITCRLLGYARLVAKVDDISVICIMVK